MVYNQAAGKLNLLDQDGKIVKSVNVNKNTIVFDIPEGETDTSKMAVRTDAMFSDGSSYDVAVYDLTDDLTASVIRVSSSVNVGQIESPIAVINKIAEVKNEDGVIVEKLYAFKDGKEIEIMTTAQGILVKGEPGNRVRLEAGDIIQFSTNIKGELENFNLLFDIQNKTTEFSTQSGDNNEMQLVYGKVTKRFTDSINVSVNGGGAMNYKTAGATVYSFDSSKNSSKLTLAEAGDIQKWESEVSESRVFIRLYKHEVKEIVIVK